MIEIKDLLARFENILLKEEGKTEAVREVISRVLNLEIKKEDLKMKNGTIYLNIKPIYKSEILLKREKIVTEMKKVLGKKSPQNIR